MTYETITVEQNEGIATVTLNRPEQLNAYTVQMGEDIVAAFNQLKVDDAVRVVILTGAGRTFCAGVDLEVLKNLDAAQENSNLPRLGEEYLVKGFGNDLFNYPKPVIAAFNGTAVGVGVTMALPCDIRIASRSAKLGLIFAKLGILPGLGSTYILPKLIGLSKAKELIYSADLISAEEAEKIGLIDMLVDEGSVLEEATKLAQKIAKHNPKVISASKAILNFGAKATDIQEAMTCEQETIANLRKK